MSDCVSVCFKKISAIPHDMFEAICKGVRPGRPIYLGDMALRKICNWLLKNCIINYGRRGGVFYIFFTYLIKIILNFIKNFVGNINNNKALQIR